MPPEAASQKTGILTPAGDIYAAGVTAYRLLNGDQALKGIVTPGKDAMDLIAKGRYPNRKCWLPHIHDQLRKAVNKALAPSFPDAACRDHIDLFDAAAGRPNRLEVAPPPARLRL